MLKKLRLACFLKTLSPPVDHATLLVEISRHQSAKAGAGQTGAHVQISMAVSNAIFSASWVSQCCGPAVSNF